jgi:hypothetical protein
VGCPGRGPGVVSCASGGAPGALKGRRSLPRSPPREDTEITQRSQRSWKIQRPHRFAPGKRGNKLPAHEAGSGLKPRRYSVSPADSSINQDGDDTPDELRT